MKNENKAQLNWYDRFIGFFSPRALVRRQNARDFLTRKYEGADGGRRLGAWGIAGASANSEIANARIRVRNRARDLVRNNPYAARGIQVIANNVVGPGIKTQIKLDKKSKVSSKEKRINETWRAWADTTACDLEGLHTLAGLQRMVIRAVAESGDVLVRRHFVKRRFVNNSEGKQIELPPIQLQILEGDFLATNNVNKILDNGNTVIEGVELDPSGRKVAYHLFKNHPGNINISIQNTFDTVRVPVEEILFIFRADRPGQFLGMSWLAPIILRMRDFDVYEDAQLKRQQCAAMFTAFVHDIEGIDDIDQKKFEDELGEKMEPGMIELLPPGKSITLSNPPGADNYKEYTTVVLRSLAVGLGITHAALTDNLAEINFSAGRLGWLEMSRNITTWQNNIMITQFLKPVFAWFNSSLELIGESQAAARAVYTPPKREMIDPVKEMEAKKASVRAGFKSISAAVMEEGKDPDTHFAEIAEDNKTLDDLGLIFDTDPRKRDKAGNSTESEKT